VREVPFGRPMIGDEECAAVMKVLEGHILTHGPKVKEFEADFAKFTGAPRALALSSATAGLHLAYFHLGIGAGDEVIVPAQTHVATAHAVEFVGAKPVFIDAVPETGNIDLDALEAVVNENTKALSVVHYLGRPVDMERLSAFAERTGLFLVEDCALSIGSTINGKHTGLFGDIGTFSFYPVKHITTAEGGALIGKDLKAIERISRLRAFGIDRNIVAERKIPGEYDVQDLGFNYRMNELSAAIGVEQIKRLPGILSRRKENFETLSKGLQEIEELDVLQAEPVANATSSYYCLVAVLKSPATEKRAEIMAALKAAGVGTSIYYPKPVPHMTYYRKKYGFNDGTFPAAARISGHGIALPVGSHLGSEDMHYIVEQVKHALAGVLQQAV